MSVINKMLQDLDKRQQGHELSNVTQPQVQYLARRRAPFNWLLLCGVSLLLGGGAVYGWQSFMAKPAEATISAQVQEQNTLTAQTEPVRTESIASSEASSNLDAAAEPLKLATTQKIATTMTANSEEFEPSATEIASSQSPEFERNIEPERQAQSKTDVSLVLENNQVYTANEPNHSQPSHSQPDSAISSVRSAEVTAGANRLAPKAQGQMAITEVKLTPKQLAKKRFTLASEAEKDGKLKEAISYYEQTLALDPSMHEARKQLVALHYGQGQLAKASEVLQQGMLLFPQQLDFALLLARVQQASGQADLALVTLANIPDTHPLARQKWMAQSDLAQKLGQFSLSEQAYRQLLQQEPQQAKWWMGLAYALDSQQQFPQARQAYRTALGHRGLSAQASAFIEQRLTQLGDSQ
ncbi:MAG: tetratricopeptide repeat protein [Gammaproteobacteria bacterium]|nr:tetratricopeptide repeat protein [Gammaproteobacteria bacterium]MBU1477909.1 tetratricopeptide repeat protein [Gammaproteobacteria bacterium]MBU2000716.1 tetratricopeptide repeat protein [Gammaproteobacteria bacterium]MBU2132102.1 tetratricopeptide repeat protein [Gammaproteobacteria bacterium]MBU2189624.1 tetratricopeptide repeat protein [Gammaproteobacteria bacterium]